MTGEDGLRGIEAASAADAGGRGPDGVGSRRHGADRRRADRGRGARRGGRCRTSMDVGDLRRLARAGRQPRPRQRAGAHRVGRLRDRDARGGGRRRHDARRHAAQLHPGDDHARRARREARAPRGQAASSTSASGAASCRATPASWRAWPTGRRARRARRSWSTRASTSSRTSTRARAARRRCRCCAIAGCRCSPTPSSDLGAAARRRRSARLRGVPARRGRAAGRTRAIALLIELCRETAARVHIVHLSSASALDADLRAAKRRGPAAHRRDLPALPVPRGRGDSRRRDPVQVRAADPRAREPRGAVAARCSTA